MIGLPSWSFIVGNHVLADSISFTFVMLPLHVMVANICPHRIEATFYALFTSFGNISMAVSGIFGGYLMQVFEVKTGQYELIWVLVVIGGVTHLLPILFLSLILTDRGYCPS